MEALLTLGILIGLDNLCFGVCIGALVPGARRRWQFAAAFGVFEATMPLVGILVGSGVLVLLSAPFELITPIVLASCGIIVLSSRWWGMDLRRLLMRSSAIFGVPLILSLDNLLGGVVVAATPLPLATSVLTIGAISAMLAFTGMFIGNAIATCMHSVRTEPLAGTALMALAVLGFMQAI